jgi:hypothetical protein
VRLTRSSRPRGDDDQENTADKGEITGQEGDSGQGGDALFDDRLGGIHQPRVDVAQLP